MRKLMVILLCALTLFCCQEKHEKIVDDPESIQQVRKGGLIADDPQTVAKVPLVVSAEFVERQKHGVQNTAPTLELSKRTSKPPKSDVIPPTVSFISPTNAQTIDAVT